MAELTPHNILDAINVGMDTSALLAALGYDAVQGRPGRHLLNNALEKRGYGRPIDEREPDRLRPHQPYPVTWLRAVAKAVTGREDTPLGEVALEVRRSARNRAQA
jgi:hypothetical protein